MAASNISHHRGSIHSTTTVPTRKILPASLAASYSTPHISFYFFYLFSIQKPFKKQSKFQFEVIFSRISSPSALRAMATCVNEVLPPSLDSSSDPPAIFDGTTKLYISYICPYAQRVWITRNYKGLQNQIKLVPIDLQNRPSWYKEKVYPPNKVPSLEHNNEVKGESLDLIKYLEENFEGPSLLPDDSAKREFAEELLSYTDTFNGAVISSFKSDKISEAGAAFDYIENALGKFDGPFLLGTFSLVDIAYVPFVERYQAFLLDVKKYDITEGRPKLAAWLEEINKIESYKVTKRDPKEYVESYKKRFLSQH